VKLSEAKIGDRVKLGITKEGHFTYQLSDAYRVIEVVVAGRQKAYPDETYIVWENCVPEFDDDSNPNQSIRRIRRQQYQIPNKFRCGYHIFDNREVELVKAAKPPSLPLLLACIGAGAALSTLSSQSTIINQSQSKKEQL
jgi:hypothetical protein